MTMDNKPDCNIYRRAKEKYDVLQEDASLYFENNKDLVAASEFESAMALGCFDREFMVFATAYTDDRGIAYRVSARAINLYRFVENAATWGLYPTPVTRLIKRLPCPSGQEAALRQSVKAAAARALRASYNQAYFQALHSLSALEANDSAYALLCAWQEELDGVYDREQLALFRGLLVIALESKVLTMRSYLAIAAWLKDMDKQLEDDILPRGLYKKTLCGFAYAQTPQLWQYFDDARPEAAYEAKAAKERQGCSTTPIFLRERWLTDMAEFRPMRRQFSADYQRYCQQGYLARFTAIKSLPGVVSRKAFDEALAFVRRHCMAEAAEVFAGYRYKWNVF